MVTIITETMTLLKQQSKLCVRTKSAEDVIIQLFMKVCNIKKARRNDCTQVQINITQMQLIIEIDGTDTYRSLEQWFPSMYCAAALLCKF